MISFTWVGQYPPVSGWNRPAKPVFISTVCACAAAGHSVLWYFVYSVFSHTEVQLGFGVVLDVTPFPLAACSSGRWGWDCANSCACDGGDGGCDPTTGTCSCQPGFTGQHCQLSKCLPPKPQLPHPWKLCSPARSPQERSQAVLPPLCPVLRSRVSPGLDALPNWISRKGIFSLVLDPAAIFSVSISWEG